MNGKHINNCVYRLFKMHCLNNFCHKVCLVSIKGAKVLDKKYIKSDLKYYEEDGKLIFKKLEPSEINDRLDKLKNKLKSHEKLYTGLISLVSPVVQSKSLFRFIKKYVNSNKLVLNIGSGNSRLSDQIYNVDVFAYNNVDIVCDIAELPLLENSADIIINKAVLEHIPNPEQVIDEIYRILKPGGMIYTSVPFMQGFHASPFDFSRFTEKGIKVLHNKFEEIEVGIWGGPTSGMLWIFQEWVAILFSFGSKKLHMIIYLFVMLLTFPVKFLDLLLVKHPMAKNIASGFVFIGRKPE